MTEGDLCIAESSSISAVKQFLSAQPVNSHWFVDCDVSSVLVLAAIWNEMQGYPGGLWGMSCGGLLVFSLQKDDSRFFSIVAFLQEICLVRAHGLDMSLIEGTGWCPFCSPKNLLQVLLFVITNNCCSSNWSGTKQVCLHLSAIRLGQLTADWTLSWGENGAIVADANSPLVSAESPCAGSSYTSHLGCILSLVEGSHNLTSCAGLDLCLHDP